MKFQVSAASWRPRLFRTAVLLGCKPSDADDIVQTTLMRAYERWDHIENLERPEAYLQRIVVNLVNDQHRFRAKEHKLVAVNRPAAIPGADISLGVEVRSTLLQLKKKHREVLVLKYYCDLSEKEIARVLRIPVGTVKSRAARAVEAFSQLFTFTAERELS